MLLLKVLITKSWFEEDYEEIKKREPRECGQNLFSIQSFSASPCVCVRVCVHVLIFFFCYIEPLVYPNWKEKISLEFP